VTGDTEVKRRYVIAGSYQQFRDLVKQRGWPEGVTRYVSDEEGLRGRFAATLYLYGTWKRQKWFTAEVERYLRGGGWEIVECED